MLVAPSAVAAPPKPSGTSGWPSPSRSGKKRRMSSSAAPRRCPAVAALPAGPSSDVDVHDRRLDGLSDVAEDGREELGERVPSGPCGVGRAR